MPPRAAAKKTVGLRATSGKRTLSFGLVRVGVSTGPALETSARVSGTLLSPEGERVKQVYRAADGTIYERSELTTGYAYEDGFVTLEDGEVPAVADGSGEVKLVARLEANELPSEWITGTNLAWPQENVHDEAYMLLASYLRGTGRVFVGTLADRGTTKVVAVRWSSVYECIIVQTLAYHAQVRTASVDMIRNGLATLADPTDEMIGMASKLFDAIPDDFAWDEVRDEYGEAMEAAIREKGETGEVTAVTAKEAGPAPGTDLLAALKASIEGAAA